MEFKFKNLGPAGSGKVFINDLSIIIGPNNTGKSYINYAVYSILKNFRSIFDFGLDRGVIEEALSELKKNRSVQIDLNGVVTQLSNVKSKFVRVIGSEIADYFQQPPANFANTEVFIKLKNLKMAKISAPFRLWKGQFGEYTWQKNGCSLFLGLHEDGNSPFSDSSLGNDSLDFCMEKIKSQIFECHFSEIVPRPFSITAERTGISVFYKSSDSGNARLIRTIRNQSERGKYLDIGDLGYGLTEAMGDNIDVIRYIEEIGKGVSCIVKEKRKEITGLFDKITDHGSYISKNNSLYYLPGKSANASPIPFEFTSSSVKSLFLFDMFIRYIAEKGDLLVIDEPELGLYIGKQIEMAHLIARLINAGVRVLITTHSDFLVREINNLIGLDNSDENERKELMKEFNIGESDLLKQSQVSAYKARNKNRISSLEIYPSGIKPDDWNNITANINMKSERIFRMVRNNSRLI